MRRLSDNTLIAYERDTRQFLQFLTGHLGEPPSLKEIGNLRIADLRSFLANRRNDGAGARTLGRGLPGYAHSCAIWKSAASSMRQAQAPCVRRASRNLCRSR